MARSRSGDRTEETPRPLRPLHPFRRGVREGGGGGGGGGREGGREEEGLGNDRAARRPNFPDGSLSRQLAPFGDTGLPYLRVIPPPVP